MATARAALLALCFLPAVIGEFLVEKGTLKYMDPATGQSKSMAMALANFGKPMYGATQRGILVYPATQSKYQCKYPDDQDIGCEYGCQDFDKAIPPLSSIGNPLHGVGASIDHAIILLDRGPQDNRACKFTLKAWNAQKARAAAVIIVNYENRLTTMDKSADQDTESYIKNLTIPAGFITKDDGNTLKQLLQKDGKYTSFEDLKLPITLSWEDILPRSQLINWEFWTNSNDACGSNCEQQKAFIKNFAPVAKKLTEQNVAVFQPHYLIWVCPPQYKDSVQCMTQCIFNGRYCCPDPEDDMEAGYDGKDVILENLRQLCVFKMANANGKPWLWWDYTTQFGEQCKMSDNKYTQECAEQVYLALGGAALKGGSVGLPDGLDGLKACIGDPNTDKENDVLEHEKQSQIGNDDVSEVSILPTIRINGGQYRGALSTMEVMRALCSGFAKDAEPTVCNDYSLTGAADECQPGEVGDKKCKENKDGKTKCVNTFGSYYCDCGNGWISKAQGDTTVCLDLNECKYLSPADLGNDCTCERCACHNQPGGYHCEAGIQDKCLSDTTCWKGKGPDGKVASACVDLIKDYQMKAVEGKADASTPLFKCECPPCFEGDGKSCTPKANFKLCNPRTGEYSVINSQTGEFHTSGDISQIVVAKGGLSAGTIVLISAVVIVVAILAAYGVYRFQRRSHMDAEIRAIMAQYMPLEKEAENGGRSHRPVSPRAADLTQRIV